jgi:hypothetical protein
MVISLVGALIISTAIWVLDVNDVVAVVIVALRAGFL